MNDLNDELENAMQLLKRRYHFSRGQGMIIHRVEAMAKAELGDAFLGVFHASEVQDMLHRMKPHQMIITFTRGNKKEENHALPIVCEQSNNITSTCLLNVSSVPFPHRSYTMCSIPLTPTRSMDIMGITHNQCMGITFPNGWMVCSS